MLRKCSRAERSWQYRMLVCREVTSTVATMVLGGREVGRDCMVSRKWLISLIFEGRDMTIDWRMYSETRSMGRRRRLYNGATRIVRKEGREEVKGWGMRLEKGHVIF